MRFGACGPDGPRLMGLVTRKCAITGWFLHTTGGAPPEGRRPHGDAFQLVSSDPLLRFDGDIHKRLEVIETECGAVASLA